MLKNDFVDGMQLPSAKYIIGKTFTNHICQRVLHTQSYRYNLKSQTFKYHYLDYHFHNLLKIVSFKYNIRISIFHSLISALKFKHYDLKN